MNESIACNPVAKSSKKALRSALFDVRLHASRDPSISDALGRRLLDMLKRHAPRRVGFYWPLEGEFDARGAIATWLALDDTREACLPVVMQRHAALAFHAWTPDMLMKVGEHRIPVPATARDLVPELVFVPCVGFDEDGYRLGYGGGYYDRTLAGWRVAGVAPIAIGVAFEACKSAALPREPHDLPLDAIITDAGCYPLGSRAASA
ncbi:5-formyltetrahydrofolate cyclo-ligase [Paraburkholderia rhizosphaerae]|uniref:5-formyltetrahydrofolate cyclo-ligase n=1 Tax=Paraburkholderia rhizosphaerae TaxID=480658 RepID=A0A4R8LVT5_9BURK|nr:5-formyltetrahydrofolate cyclo-ligase [Paraburkholderia rhizosphaerae]TDY51940.1 5,10-methenyltetrahydrofolate synthetase [Paraburkholderia rhizosphaerae]